MELALLAVWCFLVALGGGLVGLVLGNLRLPVVLLSSGVGMLRSGPPTRREPRDGELHALDVPAAVASGALGHLPNAAPDLTPILVGGAASIPGALLGSRLTGRLSEQQLTRVIGVVLLVAAASMVVEAIVR